MKDSEERSSARWLVGLRRAFTTGHTFDRWIDERGITGVVWTPEAYVPSDAASALVPLVDAGASPDRDLLWDLSVKDIRAAAATLRHVHDANDGADGYVAVWMDPDRLRNPEEAARQASTIAGDVGVPNLAVAFVWTGARAGALSAIVARGIAVAVSGAGPRDAAEGVRIAKEKGIERAASDDEEADVSPPPVFLLGSPDAPEGLAAKPLVTEFALLAAGAEEAHLPTTPADEQAVWVRGEEAISIRARLPVTDDDAGGFAVEVAERCRLLERQDVLERIWARDHTVWREETTEIVDRLGWLDVPAQMLERVPELEAFAEEVRDVERVVLCGMGGSSLAPEMFADICSRRVPLVVLDTTHPGHIEAVTSSLDLERTLFVISSKSGTTVETRSLLEHFWAKVPDGSRFVAVTDPGSPLAELGRERGFVRVFENRPDIGGRFSALSHFGLVPAVLCGVDVRGLLLGGTRMRRANGPSLDPYGAPGVRLGASLAEGWSVDRDKLTLVLPPALRSLGDWIEQLIAESTGKDDTGILPVTGEDLGPPEHYLDDRLFVAYAIGEDAFPEELEALEDEGHPVHRIRVPAAAGGAPDSHVPAEVVGAECFRWELAVAVAAFTLDIHPFDQPNVESAKERAREALKAEGGTVPDSGSASELLASLEEPDGPSYVAIQAFLEPADPVVRRLQAARMALRDRYRVATTVGVGPRFLHSTGQLHKGGQVGVCLQITGDRSTDLPVPGADHTFGRLFDAQADGDLRALRDAGRPAARLSLEDLERLAAAARDETPLLAGSPQDRTPDSEEEV